MTDKQTPPEWVLDKANGLSGWDEDAELAAISYSADLTYRALCDMIEKHEQPPVDRKLLCAREASLIADPDCRADSVEDACVRAIELWEEGFGK